MIRNNPVYYDKYDIPPKRCIKHIIALIDPTHRESSKWSHCPTSYLNVGQSTSVNMRGAKK